MRMQFLPAILMALTGCPSPEVNDELPDAAPVAPAPGCVAGSGPTMHGGSVDHDETLTAAASPHVFPFDVSVYATLTLEPCVELRLAARSIVTVRDSGQLIAEGTAARPIHLTSNGAGAFARIRSLGRPIRLAHVNIDGAGDPLSSGPLAGGALDLQGSDQTQPTQGLLAVDHVTITGSQSMGVSLHDGAGFAAGSTALTVTGSATYPVAMWERSVGTLPPGSYTGNGIDEILLAASNNSVVAESTTMHDRGVPYRVGLLAGGELRVGSPPNQPVATLTIEAGVTVRFNKSGVMQVQVGSGDTPARGALIAVGTADRPIVFTSGTASPMAGDWFGVWFGFIADPTSRMDHARVEFAGGKSSSGSSACPGLTWTTTDAAIRISGAPSSEFVTNTTISDSATHGIDRGWRADPRTDFLATNTFRDVVWCQQTYPKDHNGVCPPVASVPCPR